ncbi:hypothetical protein SEA_DARDANUS_51 [Gordonia phage Dardanus]|uniref:Uncharacterized protein n=1 Tax=Gordonia phage Dardanus TaxID=2588489 RepID=A0A514CX51_9CAUD|nr:hypothetical protein KDJ58_gp51 [Gordonia phage Dardanus]QDH85088.1 hypothetical protein SEA_DARDANUS_51 [Gordonia phage Dardanus]
MNEFSAGGFPSASFATDRVELTVSLGARLRGSGAAQHITKGGRFALALNLAALANVDARDDVARIERAIDEAARKMADHLREHFGLPSRRAQAKVNAHHNRRGTRRVLDQMAYPVINPSIRGFTRG